MALLCISSYLRGKVTFSNVKWSRMNGGMYNTHEERIALYRLSYEAWLRGENVHVVSIQRRYCIEMACGI